MKWVKIKLGEIADFSNGINFDKSAYDKGVKIISVSNFGDRFYPNYNELMEIRKDIVRESDYLKENDIVFVRSNGNKELVGRCMLVSKSSYPITFSGFCIRARLKKYINYDPVFLVYYFKSKVFKKTISDVAIGANIQNLSQNMLCNYELLAPDLPTQRRIAAVLTSLDDKIALNRRMNAKLEAMAKRLYDYWFVQFDFPDEHGKPYKSSGGKMVWNEQLKREIPAGWECGCIGDYLTIGNGKDHQKLSDGEYPVYGSGGLMRHVSCYLHDGETVLFPRKGTLNNIMYRNEKLWTVDTMFYSKDIKFKSAIFIYYSAKQYDFTKLNTGTGVPSMTSDIIKSLNIISPKHSIIEEFDKHQQPIYQKMMFIEREISRLTSLRDRLLPLLMNGQVEVLEG